MIDHESNGGDKAGGFIPTLYILSLHLSEDYFAAVVSAQIVGSRSGRTRDNEYICAPLVHSSPI